MRKKIKSHSKIANLLNPSMIALLIMVILVGMGEKMVNTIKEKEKSIKFFQFNLR